MTEIINHGKVQKLFKGSHFDYGYYAYVDSNGQFVIGEERGREGGELYRGEYKGNDTPWINDIKEENIRLYNSIIKYFDNKEYMVHIWGGAWNSDAYPSIEKDLGIKKGYHYFKTEEEKNEFCKLLHNPIYRNQGLMIDEKYGVMSHKRTIFVATFKYKDKEFIIHYDFSYEYEGKNAIFMFEDGNYSCDCNRSLFIQDEYGEDAIPELHCGHQIKMTEYHFEYED